MECKKCGYIWKNKVLEPKVCPRCKRSNYKNPRVWLTKKVEPPIINNPIVAGDAW